MSQAVQTAHHVEATSTGLNHRKLLMWAFLGGECLFFGSLISTYMIYRGRSVNGPYPDEVLNIPVTSISTFVLLMSSLAMVLALAAIQRGDHQKFRLWLLSTAALGAIFLGFQAYEFSYFTVHDHLTITKNLFGATFFILTGFHGLHVTVGVIWLLSLVFTSLKGKLPQSASLSVEIAGLYWHFVDVVWIAIFTLVYLLPYPERLTGS